MTKFLVTLPSQDLSYPIFIDHEFKKKKFWNNLASNYEKIVIITDSRIKHIVDPFIKKYIPIKKLILSFKATESAKTYQTKQLLESKLFRYGCKRNTLLISIGGGVVGDLTGFIAATYMRGISYIQIPTTLLAMVDSSIGGKTGINTKEGKNLIGAIHQPHAVLINTDFLRTLNATHMISGLMEIAKLFLTLSNGIPATVALAKFPTVIPAKAAHAALTSLSKKSIKTLIYHSIQLKAAIICQDEKEHDLRSILNFGHTIGHALEKITNYKLAHGLAVGYGILVESKISYLLGLLKKEEEEEIHHFLSKLGIKGDFLKKFNPKKIIKETYMDKKSSAKEAKYVLLLKIGQFYLNKKRYTHTVSDDIVLHAIQSVAGLT